MTKIQFANYINKRETALVGRLHGENILEKLKAKGISLRDIEKEFNIIQVVIPSTIISINKSFFLGCFGTRIQELGTEEFRNKYTFDTCAHNKRKIELHLINFQIGELS